MADCEKWMPQLPRSALFSLQDLDNRTTRFVQTGTTNRQEIITLLDTIVAEAAQKLANKGGLIQLQIK